MQTYKILLVFILGFVISDAIAGNAIETTDKKSADTSSSMWQRFVAFFWETYPAEKK